MLSVLSRIVSTSKSRLPVVTWTDLDDKLEDDASMFSTNTVNSVSEHNIEEDITSRPDNDNDLHAPEGDFEMPPL